MKITIIPTAVNGALHAPASKSSMQRACAAALLHAGVTHISNAGSSNDDKAALNIIKSLGAKLEITGDILTVTSKGIFNNELPASQTIHCGESGLAIRMFAPIAALSPSEILLTGEGSLLKRPMHFFDEIFPALGVSIQSFDGMLPLLIKGPLIPANISIDGSASSQYLTGLLFAFGAACREETVITVNGLKSKPYINLSLDVMRHFGYDIAHHQHREFFIRPKKEIETTISYRVEGDWSSASFLLVAGAIAGGINITGLNTSSSQADKAIMGVLKECGAMVNIYNDNIEIKKAALSAFHFDATDCPDLFPPLVALAAYCGGVSVIKGVSRLANKESDRAKTLQDVFGKMGVKIIVGQDEMMIHGGGTVHGALVSSHHDHRIAMAAAVAGLAATGEMIIEDAEAVNKSYPGFFEDLEKITVSTYSCEH